MAGSVEPELAANLILKRGSKRLQVPFPQSAAKDVTLPDARKLKTGGPQYYFVNGGEENAVIKDAGGSTIATLTHGDTAILLLLDNSTAAGVWVARTGTVQGYAGVSYITDPTDIADFTGPFTRGATGEDISVADGVVTLEGEDDGDGFVYCGFLGGEFLPGVGHFISECRLTEIDDSINLNEGGICATGGDFANNINWNGAGNARCVVQYDSGTNQVKVRGVSPAGTNTLSGLLALPSAVNPYWLRMEYEEVGGGDYNFEASYRIGDSGGYTPVHTRAGEPIPAAWKYKVDTGPFIRVHTAGLNRYAKFTRFIYRTLGL